MKWYFLLVLGLSGSLLAANSILEAQKKWLSTQKIAGFTFQVIPEEQYDEEGNISAIFYEGSKKLSSKEQEKLAQQLEDLDPMEAAEKIPPTITMMIMDNRIRQKQGETKITAQDYLGAMGGTKCEIKKYPCFSHQQGLMNFVAVGIDSNINLILMSTGKKTDASFLVTQTRNFNLKALESGAPAQEMKKPVKQKNLQDVLKSTNGVKELKNLFGN